MAGQTVQPRATVGVVGDMAADAGGRGDDVVPRFGQCHKGIKVGDGARRHADFGIVGIEDFGGQLGGDHLDLLHCFQPHFVFVTGVAKRGAGAKARGKRGFGMRVHDVGGGVQVKAVAFVNPAIFGNQGIQLCRCGLAVGAGGAGGDVLNIGFSAGRHPWARGQVGHDVVPYLVGFS